jgi:hypothetical protein
MGRRYADFGLARADSSEIQHLKGYSQARTALAPMSEVDSQTVRRHLDKLLVSGQLGKSESSRKLITYLVERSARDEAPKEAEIAIDVFGRDASFNGAEDSLVRVAVRTLRQKLAEYYAGPGRNDELQFVIPKGAYRLALVPNESAAALAAEIPQPASGTSLPNAGPGASATPVARPASRAWSWAAAVALTLLIGSLVANLYLWKRTNVEDASVTRIRNSAVWADIVSSDRPLMIVLGDLFMYTQTDPQTGRTQTVRDTEINSSEDLRAFLASNPSFAADRGQRYVTMIQKSAAVGMVSILGIVNRPGRRVEVRVRDEVQVEDIRNNDIIYIGPLVRLGPLAGHYQTRSRYRYDPATAGVTDLVTEKAFLPEGELGGEHKDYALAARFEGPTGNHIMIFTSGGRNAGLLQIVRTLTSADGLREFEKRLSTSSGGTPQSFEALLSVTGFKQTDLATEFIDVHALPISHSERQALAETPTR